MKTLAPALFLLLIAHPLYAQEPVVKWADWTSYGTAAVNPLVAVAEAAQSQSKGCHFARLALSEAIGNSVGLTLQHFVISARPCIGCNDHGFPSEHVINSMMGFTASDWRFGLVLGISTAGLRMDARRHTPEQVAAGLLIGAGSEFAGKLIRCP